MKHSLYLIQMTQFEASLEDSRLKNGLISPIIELDSVHIGL